jgi:hypothetical protein
VDSNKAECCPPLGYRTVQPLYEPTFRGNVLPWNLMRDDFLLGSYATLKKEDIRLTETLVHVQTTWRYIPEDGNFHYPRGENLKSCVKEAS